MPLTEFQEGHLRTKARFAVMTEGQLAGSGHKPMTREEVQREFGESVALAWDDLQAARKSYSRAVERMVQERKEEDDE